MTPEEWKTVERHLRLPFESVKLSIDGYRVTLQVTELKPLRYGITVFVNGYVKGEWITTDCEERRRFYRPRTVRLHSKAEEALYARLARITKVKRTDNPTMTMYHWDWPSFAPLKRHLIANNTSIELDRSVA